MQSLSHKRTSRSSSHSCFSMILSLTSILSEYCSIILKTTPIVFKDLYGQHLLMQNFFPLITKDLVASDLSMN